MGTGGISSGCGRWLGGKDAEVEVDVVRWGAIAQQDLVVGAVAAVFRDQSLSS
ncbi:hypothetical protein ACTG9Q_13140 [Actinokineospora sp. 24-640]